MLNENICLSLAWAERILNTSMTERFIAGYYFYGISSCQGFLKILGRWNQMMLGGPSNPKHSTILGQCQQAWNGHRYGDTRMLYPFIHPLDPLRGYALPILSKSSQSQTQVQYTLYVRKRGLVHCPAPGSTDQRRGCLMGTLKCSLLHHSHIF